MSDLIDTREVNPFLSEFADLLQELGVTGEEAMTACEGKEELSYPVYLDWGLQAIFKIASKMPDLASKVTVLREVMSMF